MCFVNFQLWCRLNTTFYGNFQSPCPPSSEQTQNYNENSGICWQCHVWHQQSASKYWEEAIFSLVCISCQPNLAFPKKKPDLRTTLIPDPNPTRLDHNLWTVFQMFPLILFKVVKMIFFHSVWQYQTHFVSVCSSSSLKLYDVTERNIQTQDSISPRDCSVPSNENIFDLLGIILEIYIPYIFVVFGNCG